jgi:hypothetical protein
MRRNREGTEVKFMNLGFRPEMVTQIILGPRASNETESELQRFLDGSGYQEVSVRRSTIPLR